jgi:hypothetical protein
MERKSRSQVRLQPFSRLSANHIHTFNLILLCTLRKSNDLICLGFIRGDDKLPTFSVRNVAAPAIIIKETAAVDAKTVLETARLVVDAAMNDLAIP